MVSPLHIIDIGGDIVDHVMILGGAMLAVWGWGRRIYAKHMEERESGIRLRKAFIVLVDQVRQTQDVVRQLANERWVPGDPRKRKIDDLTDFLYQAEGNPGHRGSPNTTGLSMYELKCILAKAGKGE